LTRVKKDKEMTRQQRYDYVLTWFQANQPDPETELDYGNPFELLVAVILSAQCTDKRVNLVTPELFRKYPTAKMMARAEPEDIFPFIRSVSFANNKSRHLAGMARMVMEKFEGEIPQTVDELVELPGVGRKTANVITSVIWSQPNMAVDTHVFRVASRIGLILKAKNPLQAEEQLIKFIPQGLVHQAHHWLILHGRYICLARRPLCEQCRIQEACNFFQKEMKSVLAGQRKYDPSVDAVNKL
jgi:endonuclease-3